MNARHFFKSALCSSAFIFIFLVVFSQNASALKLEPLLIQESEGTVVQIRIQITKSDWMRPDDNFSSKFAAIGISAQWVARYYKKG